MISWYDALVGFEYNFLLHLPLTGWPRMPHIHFARQSIVFGGICSLSILKNFFLSLVITWRWKQYLQVRKGYEYDWAYHLQRYFCINCGWWFPLYNNVSHLGHLAVVCLRGFWWRIWYGCRFYLVIVTWWLDFALSGRKMVGYNKPGAMPRADRCKAFSLRSHKYS